MCPFGYSYFHHFFLLFSSIVKFQKASGPMILYLILLEKLLLLIGSAYSWNLRFSYNLLYIQFHHTYIDRCIILIFQSNFPTYFFFIPFQLNLHLFSFLFQYQYPLTMTYAYKENFTFIAFQAKTFLKKVLFSINHLIKFILNLNFSFQDKVV